MSNSRKRLVAAIAIALAAVVAAVAFVVASGALSVFDGGQQTEEQQEGSGLGGFGGAPRKTNVGTLYATDQASLESAVNSIPANGAGTVELRNDITVGKRIDVGSGKDVSFTSADGGQFKIEQTSTGTGDSARHFSIADNSHLELDHVVLSGAGGEGGVYISEGCPGASVTLGEGAIIEDCVFADGATQGGGVCMKSGELTIRGGTIRNCSVNLDYSVVGKPATYSGGGGIYALNSNVSILSGSIQGCSANNGGGICLEGSSCTMSDGRIAGNSATMNIGGGVNVYKGSSFALEGGAIEGNGCGGSYGIDGGGIFVEGKSSAASSLTMTGGSVRANSCNKLSAPAGVRNGNGGGICARDWTAVRVEGGVIGGDSEADANIAQGGGGISMCPESTRTNTTTLTITGGQVKGNVASFGGGICANGLSDDGLPADDVFELSGTASVENNKALRESSNNHGGGGGVYASDVNLLVDGAATVCNNSADSEAGGFYVSGGTASMHGSSKVEGNTVKPHPAFGDRYGFSIGGGVVVAYCTFTMGGNLGDSVQVSANEASNGGGFHVSNRAKLVVRDGSVISGNTSRNSGGGMYLDYSNGTEAEPVTLQMEGGSVSGNTALGVKGAQSGGGGGGIYNLVMVGSPAGEDCTKFSITGGSITGNAAPNGDGGGIHCYTGHVSGSTLPLGNWECLEISPEVEFSGNVASSACQPTQEDVDKYPLIESRSVSIPGMTLRHPLNNYDINYVSDPDSNLHVVYHDNFSAWPGLPNDGVPPVDPISYADGAEACVLGNIGTPSTDPVGVKMRLEGKALAGWSLVPKPGDGDRVYRPGELLEVLASLADADGNVHLYAVWTDKIPEPTIAKKVDADGLGWKTADDTQIGQTAEYELTVQIPYLEDYPVDFSYKLQIIDVLPAGLTLVEAGGAPSVSVYVKSTLLSKDADPGYTLNVTPGTGAGGVADGTNVLAIDIVGLRQMDVEQGDMITIRYQATLNENAQVGGDGNPNVAHVVYSNPLDPDDPEADPGTSESASVTATLYTFKFLVDKVVEGGDVESAARLAGAEFKLRTSDDTTTEDNLVKLVKLSDGKYRVATQSEIAAAGAAGSAVSDSFVTPESAPDVELGRVSILGLDASGYYLEEIQAPIGYNKLIGPLRISIDARYGTGGNLDSWKVVTYGADGASTDARQAVDGSLTRIVITNKAGAVLPTTGGVGTSASVVSGISLVIAGLVMRGRLVRSKGRAC